MSKEMQKGAGFEKDVVDDMRSALCDQRIERRAKNGRNDRGDIAGVFFKGKRVVLEVKNCKQMRLSEWLKEAEIEKGNDDAEFCAVVHHRKGCGRKKTGESYVTMTLRTFEAMIAGSHDLLYRVPALFGNSESASDAYEYLGIDEDG